MMTFHNRLKPISVGYYRFHDVILGKGNFATVYLARHKIIGCEVALKVINTDDVDDEYVLQNLEREAHILTDLQHPNIIRLYETVKSDNLYCLSLERIRGVNLFQYLMKQEHCRISEKLGRIFFYQTLSAVEYMHNLQVIHRDLKLENILVEYGHVIKIIDFGLSNLYYPCFRLRTHCGSVEYAAPELFRSMSAYGLAVDLWSLGVILYAMLVGQMPFHFNRKKSELEDANRKREKFRQRISRGLMQENWEQMEGLSPECWKLLHALLEPDQFQRIRIKDAVDHPWITKDEHLKKQLPQKRKDLERFFHPQILEYLADLLNTSKTRIEKRISAGYFNNRTSSLYSIILDTLVKETSYPPKNYETSFSYRFERWKENSGKFFPMPEYSNEYQQKEYCNEKIKSEIYPPAKILQTKTSSEHKPSLKIHSITKDAENPKSDFHSKIRDFVKLGVTCKGVNEVCLQPTASKHFKTDWTEYEQNAEQNVSRKPYRSYKNSRPENINKNVIIEKSTSVEKTNQNLHGLKHDVKEKRNSLMGEKLYDPFSHDQQLAKEKYKTEKKQSNKINTESYTILRRSFKNSNMRTNQPESITYSQSKTPISKAPNASNSENRKICPGNIRTKVNLSIDGAPGLKNAKSQKDKTKVVTKILKKDSTARQTVSKRLQDNYTSLIGKAQILANNFNRSGESEKAIHMEAPSRIPIKNIRYGPPAPFSQSVNNDKTMKLSRTTADRTNFCRGDTNEKSARKKSDV